MTDTYVVKDLDDAIGAIAETLHLGKAAFGQSIELAIIEIRGTSKPYRGNLHRDQIIFSLPQKQEIPPISDVGVHSMRWPIELPR